MQSLTVPGTLDSLSAIADFIKTAAATAGLDKKASYRLRLAVDEIATNVIVHGYEEAGLEGVLDLTFDVDEKALTFGIEDTGAAYDPHQHLLPEEDALKLPLEQRQVGGLGIYLALQGVDKFIYERDGDRNRNTFVMNR
ncbi:MAG: ATP-binding protein [Tildeniella nuda ZEHNDER 1965/U140]|jgi:anti-sigma regulatory factor (Ser/Thr protein kinase)|nr:ATP-binding protein [Tildeniella nuda ZEHNDER 1965/U140]